MTRSTRRTMIDALLVLVCALLALNVVAASTCWWYRRATLHLMREREAMEARLLVEQVIRVPRTAAPLDVRHALRRPDRL